MSSTSIPVEALGTILSVWAHPDDETYLAAGVMSTARDNGQRVVCASASAGERGTADARAWPPERLGRVRRWEADAAMSALGVTEHSISTFADGSLSEFDEAGRSWVAGLVADVRPDTILTFGPDGMTHHPDHIAVHRWVTRAWLDEGRRARLLYATATVELLDRYRDQYEEWNMYMTDERPIGVPTSALTVHGDLTGPSLDRKVTALRAMASQTADLIAHLGLDAYALQVAEEAFIDAAVVEGSIGR